MKLRSAEFAFAFRQTIPVLLGYIAIGLAFGLMLSGAGFPWWLALLMCLIIYAGAGQYMAVGFFTTNLGLAECAIMTLLINARHMVYGVSLLDRFRNFGAAKAYLIFALTDETYALQTSLKEPAGLDRKQIYLWISGLDQLYWTIGGVVGAVAGALLPIPTQGLGFALTALFAVLLLEQFKSRLPGLQQHTENETASSSEEQIENTRGNFSPFIIAAAACALSMIIFGTKNMLLPAIGIAIVALIASQFIRELQRGKK